MDNFVSYYRVYGSKKKKKQVAYFFGPHCMYTLMHGKQRRGFIVFIERTVFMCMRLAYYVYKDIH